MEYPIVSDNASHAKKLSMLKATRNIVGTDNIGVRTLRGYIHDLMSDYTERTAQEVRRALGYGEEHAPEFSAIMSYLSKKDGCLTKRSVVLHGARQYLYTLATSRLPVEPTVKGPRLPTYRPAPFTPAPRFQTRPVVLSATPILAIPHIPTPAVIPQPELVDAVACVTIKGQTLTFAEADLFLTKLQQLGFGDPDFKAPDQHRLVRQTFKIYGIVLEEAEFHEAAIELIRLLR